MAGGFSYGGAGLGGKQSSGLSSAQNASRSRVTGLNNDDSDFGISRKPTYNQAGTYVRNDTFAGAGSRHGSAHGSRKSQAEAEADELNAMLDEIIKPAADEKPVTSSAVAPNNNDPLPTGTFRNSENDGWDDLNFGEAKKSSSGHQNFGGGNNYTSGLYGGN